MIKVNIVTLECVRESIPEELVGLTEHTLQNLQTELGTIPPGLEDYEFWPESDDTPVYDSRSHELSTEILTPDAGTKTVSVVNALIERNSVEVLTEYGLLIDVKADVVRNAGFESTVLSSHTGPVTKERYSDLSPVATHARKKKGAGQGVNKQWVKSSFGGYLHLTNNDIDDFETECSDFMQSVIAREAAIYDSIKDLSVSAMPAVFDAAIDAGWPS